MRTISFIQALLASIVLSACASDSSLDPPPRTATPDVIWRARTVYVAPSQVLPQVDTRAQSEALRRTPHGGNDFKGANGQR